MCKKKLLFQIFVTILFFKGVAFGQAPDLGAAASFSLFTAAGAFTNTGATTVRGDVGTNVGVFTGLDQTAVGGQIQVATAGSAQAATDVQNAYNALSAAPCGATIGVGLGGQTLLPGTYCTGAAAALDGALTLDAQGDNTAVFIINVGGALATSAASSVVLRNGAAVANVYWRVAGGLDVGENGVFQGTALVDGAIKLLDGATLFGRALSRAGAITLQTNRVQLQAASPLPVVLTAFGAERQAAATLLSWATASERNSAYFEVQRSTDGLAFARLGRVPAQGQATLPHGYTWLDRSAAPAPGTVVYYRLLQVDLDGTGTYSPVRNVAPATRSALQFRAFPNPAPGAVAVQVEADQAGPATLRLTDALGQLVVEMQLTLAAGPNLLDLPAMQRLGAGYYHLRLLHGQRQQTLTLMHQ